MNAQFFDFTSQNQKIGHSFKMFFGGASRQRSFETGSGFLRTRRAFGPPCTLSGSQASPAE
jgi:hypothetical protein